MLQATSSQPAMFLRKYLCLFDHLLTSIERFVIGLAACVIVVVMCIVAADALGRYLFNAPVFFTVDLVSRYLLPVIMLMSAGFVLRRAGHISVDLFASVLPVRLYQLLAGLALASAVPVFGIMTYRVGFTALESFEQGKVAFGIVPWPFWLEQAIYAVCMGLLSLRLFQMSVANLAAAVTNEPEIGIGMLHSHKSPIEETI